MLLPKYLRQRGGVYYVRRALPLDVQPAFGRKEIWISLRTSSRREAEARSHAAIAKITDQIEAKRRERRAADEEREFLASERCEEALATYVGAARALDGGGQPFARRADSVEGMAVAAEAVRLGQVRPRPRSRAEAAAIIEHDLAELEAVRRHASLVRSVDPHGEPDFGSIPARYVPALMARLTELFEADKRTMEAQLAAIGGTDAAGGAADAPCKSDPGAPEPGTMASLVALWEAQRKPSPRTRLEGRTAVARFERVNGPLPYSGVTDEHARRFKADLLGDAGLKNATRRKLWGLLRALLGVAVDDGLLEANPFARVKIRLDDDSAARETLTRQDLAALFGGLRDEEEWWIGRIGLYTGARLGEICQLTRSDLVTVEGVPCLHIRDDVVAGKRVKNRGSVRKVPLHRQLVADGVLEWIASREGDALFTLATAVASKRLNRRMRAAGLGEAKVFHSLRHTFKSAARRCMDAEWHDRLTGHAHRTAGESYGDYDLRTMKEKLDLVAFGAETPAGIPAGKSPAPA